VGAVISDLDIWRAAHVFAQQHGEAAVAEAEARAAGLQAAGDSEGAAMWLRIATALRALARDRGTDEALH
jgi:hypothetical protein